MGEDYRYYNRELSWLRFNHRVLQEAANQDLSLAERIQFLAIYSSNLDEFFRVRVATIKNLNRLRKKDRKLLDFDPEKLLFQIIKETNTQKEEFERIFYKEIIAQMKKESNLHLINPPELAESHIEKIRKHFRKEIKKELNVRFFEPDKPPFLENRKLYLVLTLLDKTRHMHIKYAVVNIPSDKFDRFYSIQDGDQFSVVFLDDVIKMMIPEIITDYQVLSSYSMKLTRDAELDIDDEYTGDLIHKMEKALKKRKNGPPSSFHYDRHMPYEHLMFLKGALRLSRFDLIPDSEYQNHSDLFKFPNPENRLKRPTMKLPMEVPHLNNNATLFDQIAKKDQLLYFPFHSYRPVTRFLQVASEDPEVSSIKIVLYRVAGKSRIVSSLLKAVQNGKKVTAFVEVKARFDEEPNLYWARKMEKAGVKVLYSLPGLKVHCKLCVVTKINGDKKEYYTYLGTGNFNENTAKIYADFGLLTSKRSIGKDARQVFELLENIESKVKFEQLVLAPFHMRKRYYELIEHEIKQAKAGKKAHIIVKMNSLQDKEMINRLYKASNAGVKIQIIVRGICCLIPGVKGLSENIKAYSIVGTYLEHARVFYFHNSGNDVLYISSADWMTRNLSKRIEVAFPILDLDVKKKVLGIIKLQLKDNLKARVVNISQTNAFKRSRAQNKIDSQAATFDYLK